MSQLILLLLTSKNDCHVRIEDIEKEVTLPPIQQETVFLDLDPYAVLSYNAMQAVIAINAIDSERKDEVYDH